MIVECMKRPEVGERIIYRYTPAGRGADAVTIIHATVVGIDPDGVMVLVLTHNNRLSHAENIALVERPALYTARWVWDTRYMRRLREIRE